jgi:geranylgeranyl diphosphate synthase type I
MWNGIMELKSELENKQFAFEEYWKKYLPESNPINLYNASRHLTLGGGKRLRPAIAMFTCESISGEFNAVLPFASALELMHNFTLVHDDIMDKSDLRRNRQTVHRKYGEPTAILAGDFLFAKSFEAMHDLKIDLEIFKKLDLLLVQCVLNICKGQQLDIEYEKKKMISEEEYIEMISKKTAVLFELSARGGAIIGGGAEEEINACMSYGLNLGLAFQIWDDYLDVSSDEITLGKDIGNDIRNGKKTLIAVNSLQNATGDNLKILEDLFGNKDASDEDIKLVFNVFKETGSIEYARTNALGYINKAKEALNSLRDSEHKHILKDLADYSIIREK